VTDDTTSPEENPDKKPETTKDKVVAGTKKTVEVVNAFGMVKWIAIAVVTLSLLGGGYAVYKTVMAPVKAMGDAAGTVAEKVGEGAGVIADGAGSVMEGAGNMINRLDIPTTDQTKLNRLSEAAFPILFKMEETKPDGVRERMFRRTNFSDSAGQVCKMEMDLGGGTITSYVAADVKAHETSAQLGSKENRKIRMVIRATDDDLKFNSVWSEDSENWQIKWSKTTVSKEVGDKDAESLLFKPKFLKTADKVSLDG